MVFCSCLPATPSSPHFSPPLPFISQPHLCYFLFVFLSLSPLISAPHILLPIWSLPLSLCPSRSLSHTYSIIYESLTLPLLSESFSLSVTFPVSHQTCPITVCALYHRSCCPFVLVRLTGHQAAVTGPKLGLLGLAVGGESHSRLRGIGSVGPPGPHEKAGVVAVT